MEEPDANIALQEHSSKCGSHSVRPWKVTAGKHRHVAPACCRQKVYCLRRGVVSASVLARYASRFSVRGLDLKVDRGPRTVKPDAQVLPAVTPADNPHFFTESGLPQFWPHPMERCCALLLL